MTIKSSVSLTDEQLAFAKALVDEGNYASVSAVLQQGVELLRRRLEGEEVETAALATLLAGRRTGVFVDCAAMEERIAAIVAKQRRRHALPGCVRGRRRTRLPDHFRAPLRQLPFL